MYDYISITYEGTKNYKLPKEARVLAAGSGDELPELLAYNILVSILIEEAIPITGDEYADYLDELTGEIENLRNRLLSHKYQGKLVKLEGNKIVPVEEE